MSMKDATMPDEWQTITLQIKRDPNYEMPAGQIMFDGELYTRTQQPEGEASYSEKVKAVFDVKPTPSLESAVKGLEALEILASELVQCDIDKTMRKDALYPQVFETIREAINGKSAG